MNIEEDWEYEAARDYMYHLEEQMRIEEEWRAWEEELNRKPAIIKLIQHENNNKRKSVCRNNKKGIFNRSYYSPEAD